MDFFLRDADWYIDATAMSMTGSLYPSLVGQFTSDPEEIYEGSLIIWPVFVVAGSIFKEERIRLDVTLHRPIPGLRLSLDLMGGMMKEPHKYLPKIPEVERLLNWFRIKTIGA